MTRREGVHFAHPVAFPASARTYVSIDIDVLDLSLIPGCVSAEPNGMTYAELRDTLAATIVLPTDSGATMRIRKPSTPESEHRELYRRLGVDAKIVSPKTIRSETGAHE